jgi:hypothetical protein
MNTMFFICTFLWSRGMLTSISLQYAYKHNMYAIVISCCICMDVFVKSSCSVTINFHCCYDFFFLLCCHGFLMLAIMFWNIYILDVYIYVQIAAIFTGFTSFFQCFSFHNSTNHEDSCKSSLKLMGVWFSLSCLYFGLFYSCTSVRTWIWKFIWVIFIQRCYLGLTYLGLGYSDMKMAIWMCSMLNFHKRWYCIWMNILLQWWVFYI